MNVKNLQKNLKGDIGSVMTTKFLVQRERRKKRFTNKACLRKGRKMAQALYQQGKETRGG